MSEMRVHAHNGQIAGLAPETLSGGDRTGFTLFGSALIHVLVIMGIGFTYSVGQSPDTLRDSLDTALVTSHSSDKVDEANLFAASAQQGGGLGDLDDRVSSPLPPVTAAQSRLQETERRAAERATREAVFMYVDLPAEVLASLTPPEDGSTEPPTDSEALPEATVAAPIPTEMDSEFRTGIKVPRQKFISSRTREHHYASYMESWRAQVEQVGNLNYPEAARTRQLSGDLVLNVSIRPDGSVEKIEVIRSSGRKILDDAAVRIVNMAAPFDPFPEEISRETDLIHITRTWQFLHNSALIRN